MTEQEEFEFRRRLETESVKKSPADQLAADRELYSPTRGNSFGQNLVEGVGRGVASVGRGLAGLIPGVVKPEDTAESARLDAPLLATGGGKVGNVIGNAAVAAPLAMVPGANTALGASALGAVFGGATTEGNAGDKLIGAGLGAAGGMAGVGLGKGAGLLADRFKTSNALAQAANAGRDTAAVDAKAAGFVLPQNETNPTLLNQLAVGLSGKIKTSQAASAKNQVTSNQLVKQEFGLPTDRPVSVDALDAVRKRAGQAYDAVKSAGTINTTAAYDTKLDSIVAPYLSAAKGFPNAKPNPIIAEIESLRSPQFDAASAVGKIKELRESADALYTAGNKSGGKALKSAADAIEDQIDQHLVATGAPPDVLQNFRDARQTIAKTYSVQKGLNVKTGDVSMDSLGNQLAKGKPLSGNLLKIAEANVAFPKATQGLKQNYNATSPWDYAMAAGTTAISGNPLALAMPAIRPGVRAALLSKAAQSMSNTPNYGSNKLMELLRDNRALPIAGIAPANQ